MITKKLQISINDENDENLNSNYPTGNAYNRYNYRKTNLMFE
jgi:hypothetical protein